jgi:hypothetical protein
LHTHYSLEHHQENLEYPASSHLNNHSLKSSPLLAGVYVPTSLQEHASGIVLLLAKRLMRLQIQIHWLGIPRLHLQLLIVRSKTSSAHVGELRIGLQHGIDWDIGEENLRESVAALAPEYWDALQAYPFGVVRMTKHLYLLLDWNSSTRELVVCRFLKISDHYSSLKSTSMSPKWSHSMGKRKQRVIVRKTSASIDMLSIITAIVYQSQLFLEENLRLSWCFTVVDYLFSVNKQGVHAPYNAAKRTIVKRASGKWVCKSCPWSG